MKGPVVTLVVAKARNGVIGRGGALPWRLPSDLRAFKAYTMGKPIVMGRKTWESLPKAPLPGRTNVVVTRNADFAAPGARIAGTLHEALAIAAEEVPGDEICVIGGGEIYREALELADRLMVTEILAEIAGDTFFPDIDGDVWAVAKAENPPADMRDSHATRRIVYERRAR